MIESGGPRLGTSSGVGIVGRSEYRRAVVDERVLALGPSHEVEREAASPRLSSSAGSSLSPGEGDRG